MIVAASKEYEPKDQRFRRATMDGGGLVVGDDVAITIDLEMVQKPAAKSGN